MKGFKSLLEIKNFLQFNRLNKRAGEYIFPCSLIQCRNIVLILFLLIFSNNTFSNDPSPREDYLRSEIKEGTFNDGGWKNAIDGLDYSREVAKKKKKKNEDHPEPDKEDEDERVYDDEGYIDPPNWGSFMTNFFKFLMILIGVVVVGFVIANFIGADGFTGRPSNKKVKKNKTGPITLENVEENIHESDLDQFLKDALAKEDYTQAVRLYYLAIIKELSLNKWIKWKKDKTNRDYTKELSSTNFKDSFREVTRIFERVWYGNKELGGMDFRASIQPKMQQLLEVVKQAGRKV